MRGPPHGLFLEQAEFFEAVYARADLARGAVQGRAVGVGNVQLQHLLHAVHPQEAGDAHVDVAEAVLAAEEGGAGQELALVAEDGLDHAHGAGAGA